MKKNTFTTIFAIILVFFGCKSTHQPMNPAILAILEKMVDGWETMYCDYPKSVQEILNEFEENDEWRESPAKDSIENALKFLREENQHIDWLFTHPSLITMDLTVLFHGDTIYRNAGKFSFPGLDVSLYSYNWYYLEYPDSIEQLIVYDSLSNCLHQGFYRCSFETLHYLLANKDKIVWNKEYGDIFIIAGNDTIAAQGYDSRIRYCDELMASNKNICRIFDKKGRYAYSEEIEKEIRHGLDEMKAKGHYELPSQASLHLLVFVPCDGLRLFCDDEDISLNSAWFHELENYLEGFCVEHGIGKLIFASPSLVTR